MKSQVYSQEDSIPMAEAVVVGAQGQAGPTAPTAPSAAATNMLPTQQISKEQREQATREYLTVNGFTPGLQTAILENLTKVAVRYFIIDDSGSMGINDGNQIVLSAGKKSMVKCSRWAELGASIRFHIGLARAAGAPTVFRPLNGLRPIRIGFGDADEQTNVNQLLNYLNDYPDSGTPLCTHITAITQEIANMQQSLRQNGQKACVTIATDGEASDGNVATALEPIKHLPAFVVLRLCTDEERIVKYWSDIDRQFELNLDILDDFEGEAQEVHEHNPWLTYGEPLHRMREFGVTVKEMDLLDEQSLSYEQMRVICRLIYGGRLDEYPHPEADFHAFSHHIDTLQRALPQSSQATWDCLSRRDRGWIDNAALRHKYAKSGCVIC